MAQAYNLKTQEAGAGGSGVQEQPQRHWATTQDSDSSKKQDNKNSKAAKTRKERKSSKNSQIGYLVRTHLITQGSLSNYCLLKS